MLISERGIPFLLTNSRIKYILLMIIYALSPVDLIPEAILGPLGLVDDSVVILNIFRQVSRVLGDFVRL